MIIKFRSGWLFPLVLAVVLGGLSAWLGRISEVQVEETKLNPNEPKYEMQGLSGKRFDESGFIKENLSAVKAWQLPDTDEVMFAEPDLSMFNQGRQIYHVTSKDARYDTEKRQVYFENDVVLTKAAEAGKPAGMLKTSRIIIDTQTENARTDAKVEYHYGQSHGTANGLTYDNEKGILNLPSRVKAIIYDPKNP
ncbi:LPS export ABC transporter periplasmic protein LptC [Neisseria sp. 83E34]|uniref:LPS export ABC transporter periplasmic protein LptC n=1 Tax=Neisseria sp. 83E34 TaxID=1692264 RepID=UPI0006CE7C1D|nr:LPS export ABC transporter periplasmic protein LptC [Neisseria sp. 83E34]KPN72351.1 lipopolysaccharide-assembly, LptC-related family protein [Neisseria sp. 83E34]